MKSRLCLLVMYATLVLTACKTTQSATGSKDDGKIDVVFVQVNDVYEIAPVSEGKEGGMARVATLKKQYKSSNPNTYLVMAGDFLSPSVYNSIEYNGKKIRGAQMVDAMNAAGMDFVTFGNHEFDLKESELQSRINESAFKWISSNTFHKVNNTVVPFEKTVSGNQPFPKTYILNVADSDGTTARIGFFGLCLPANKAAYVHYDDCLATAKQMYEQLKDSVDAVVAITHQAVGDDIAMAKALPNLAAVLGGHEHGMEFKREGNVYITKAHANARSAYVVKLSIDKKKHTVTTTPEIKYLNESVTLDSSTTVVVDKWRKIAEDNFASLGFDPHKEIIHSGEVLDGRETQTRTGSTNLTRLIAEAMKFACPQADVVIYNSGSIRVDDELKPPITQYDILRTLPFGGGIKEVDMKGSLLLKILHAGVNNIGTGGFLQYLPVMYTKATNTFFLGRMPIIPGRVYRVALTDFLLTGMEANLDFLTEQNAEIVKVYPTDASTANAKSDIRLAVIKYLESKK